MIIFIKKKYERGAAKNTFAGRMALVSELKSHLIWNNIMELKVKAYGGEKGATINMSYINKIYVTNFIDNI